MVIFCHLWMVKVGGCPWFLQSSCQHPGSMIKSDTPKQQRLELFPTKHLTLKLKLSTQNVCKFGIPKNDSNDADTAVIVPRLKRCSSMQPPVEWDLWRCNMHSAWAQRRALVGRKESSGRTTIWRVEISLNLTIIFACLADKCIFIHICRINVSIHSSYLPGAVTEIKCDAQVYTTAGREEKRQYLRDLGVKYITSSRNGSLVITHVVLAYSIAIHPNGTMSDGP